MDQKSQTTYDSLMDRYSGRTPAWCVVNRAKYLSTDLANTQAMIRDSELLNLEAIALANIQGLLKKASELNESHKFNKQLSLQASLSG